MKKTRTTEHNGDSAVEPSVLDIASSLYADWRSIGFNREDVFSLLCGLLFVAVSDKPRKPKRRKARRPRAKGGVGVVAGNS